MIEWCEVCARRVNWLSYCLHCGTKVDRGPIIIGRPGQKLLRIIKERKEAAG